MTRGTLIKLVLGVLMTGGAGTAIFFEMADDDQDSPPVPRPMPVAKTLNELILISDPQDAALTAALAQTARYTLLPFDSFWSLKCDPNGDVWFEIVGRDDEFKRSIERAAHGQTRIIRGGELLLVDRQHRFWGTSFAKPSELLCYDGTQWLAPRDSNAPPPPTTAPGKNGSIPPRANPADFIKAAVQDVAGDCYFIAAGNNTPARLHRFGADGQWTDIAFPDHAVLDSNWLMTAQNNGRVAIYAQERIPQGNGGFSPVVAKALLAFAKQKDSPLGPVPFGGSGAASAYVWDGDAFTTFSEHDPANADKAINGVSPLPDGSLLLTYQGSDEVALRWPGGRSHRLDAAANKLIAIVAARDPHRRMQAFNDLVKLGPQIKPLIDAALADPANAAPQKQASLQAVSDELSGVADPTAGASAANPPSAALFGGRYELKNVQQASRRADGSVLLFANECKDVTHDESHGPSFVTVDAAGKWSVNPLPDDRSLAWLPSAAAEGLEDAHGRLWIKHVGADRFTVVADLNDLKVRAALPPGVSVGEFVTSDRDGRVYCSTPGGLLRIDPSQPEPKPELPSQRVAASKIVQMSGDAALWLYGDWPTLIKPVGPPARLPIQANHRCSAIYPMRNGASFVETRRRGEEDGDVFDGYWQGTTVVSVGGDSHHDTVEPLATQLMANAPFDFQPTQLSSRLERIASDHGKGLWCMGNKQPTGAFVMDNTIERSLDYYDGSAWHDAWDLLKTDRDPDDDRPFNLSSSFEVLGAIDHGHTVLVRSAAKSTIAALGFENGALQRKDLQIAGSDGKASPPSAGHLLLSSSGRAWLSNGNISTANQPGNGRLYAIEGNQLTPMPWSGVPVLADSKDRIWCVDNQTISVISNGTAAKLPVSDVDNRTRVIESPDGRLWLLHTSGIDQLQIAADGTPSLAKHWNWNLPINDFNAYCDGQNHLWLAGEGNEALKIDLP